MFAAVLFLRWGALVVEEHRRSAAAAARMEHCGGCLFSMLLRSRMFWLFDTCNAMIIAMTIAVAVSFGQGIMFVPEATWAAELFQARLRYSGSSLGFQIGAALSAD